MKKNITKVLICIIFFLTIGIISKTDYEIKKILKTKLYEESLSFTKFEKIYNKYLGGIFPIENIKQNNITPVFNEKLTYKNVTKYKDGIILETTEKYLIPNLENGIIIYIGEKKGYGEVIIVENENNINIWYGNVCNYNLKLYDRINKGDIIGETCKNQLFLLFKKDNKVLDYNNYIN